mgnify:CR=1 FL=1
MITNLLKFHADNEEAFRNACYNGHESIAHWLISLDPAGFTKEQKDKSRQTWIC